MVTTRALPALAMLPIIVCPTHAAADDGWAEFASGPGNLLYLAAGVGLPLLRDGRTSFVRTLDAVGTSVLLSEALKRLTRVPRPDTGEHESFPSGHATAAFAVATMESAFHPKEAPLWYLGASLIAYSRVSLDRHRPADVVGGAALGFLTSRWEISSPRGLILFPFVDEHGGYGLSLTNRF